MSAGISSVKEPASDLWLERSYFAGEFLGCVAYGIHAAIFAATVYFMTRKMHRQNLRISVLAFVCTLFTLGTISVAATVKFCAQSWIDHRLEPGGPATRIKGDFTDPISELKVATYIVTNFLAVGIMLYRLWVVWNHNCFVMILPGLAYAGTTAIGILSIYKSVRSTSLFAHTTAPFAMASWLLAFLLNLFVTSMIIFRLVMLRRKTKGLTEPYTSVVAMIIESAAPYSFMELFYVICYARNSNIQNLVLPVLRQVMCISPEFILLRVWMRRTPDQITGAKPHGGSPASRLSGISFAINEPGQHKEDV
ncbi:hypothetical protein BD410DRAFT_790366 [Rickenella mellea]|uniref:Uncharacterized protein n=1 Tax=Rickenella mellea TaxID=50990 RepID=A0A4Y7Q1F5_9AGAM|nr:hypothetical protein BD410DRAFT_790366 [Rickenella mellea]